MIDDVFEAYQQSVLHTNLFAIQKLPRPILCVVTDQQYWLASVHDLSQRKRRDIWWIREWPGVLHVDLKKGCLNGLWPP